MKLYGLYTPTHEVLLRDWFIPSLRDDYDLRIELHDQIGAPERHLYGTSEFNETTFRKVAITLQAIEDNWNDIFLVSDVDIQFFGQTESLVKRAMKNRDIVFQQNQTNGEINAGFFACRANTRTKQLWQAVRQVMQERPDWNDQDAINHLIFRELPWPLRGMPMSHLAQHRLAALAERGVPTHWTARVLSLFRGPFKLHWGYLPPTFFLKGLCSRGNWEPGQSMRIPKNIVMHHANFCVGVDVKVKQLRAVADVVARRQGEASAVEQPLG